MEGDFAEPLIDQWEALGRPMNVGGGITSRAPSQHSRGINSVLGGVEADEVPQPRRRSAYGPSSAGSYGFLVKALAEGLDIAHTKGWLTDEEAKREFRSHVHVIQEDEVRTQRIAELEAEVQHMEEALTEARAKVAATKGSA